jgi:hypothetical protein
VSLCKSRETAQLSNAAVDKPVDKPGTPAGIRLRGPILDRLRSF